MVAKSLIEIKTNLIPGQQGEKCAYLASGLPIASNPKCQDIFKRGRIRISQSQKFKYRKIADLIFGFNIKN
jgi:hypothetical protein